MDEEKRAQEAIGAYEKAVEDAGGREKLLEALGDVTVKLTKPVEHEGRQIQEAHLNLLGLTGLDMEIIDDRIGASGLRGVTPAYSRRYQRMLAARACDLPEDVIARLPLADYNAVTGAVRNFLMISG